MNRSSGETLPPATFTIFAYTTGSAAISAPIHSALPRPSRLSVTPASVCTVAQVPGGRAVIADRLRP
jgi:hypothetical protein